MGFPLLSAVTATDSREKGAGSVSGRGTHMQTPEVRIWELKADPPHRTKVEERVVRVMVGFCHLNLEVMWWVAEL